MGRRSEGGRYAAGTRYRKNVRGYNATRKRRRQLRAFYISVFVIVVFIAAAVLTRLLLKVSEIVVTGSSVYSQEDIQKACPIEPKENLLSADLDNAEKVIAESLPYIGEVEVSRRFPSKIIVNVVNAEELCLIHQGSYGVVVSDQQKILQVEEFTERSLVNVEGIILYSPVPGHAMDFQNDEMQTVFTDVFEMLKKVEFPMDRLTTLNFDDLTNICLVYEGRVTVTLGSTENLEYKLTFAKNLLENSDGTGIDQDAEGTLDLSRASDTDSAVFSPKTESEPVEEEPSSSESGEENTESLPSEDEENSSEEENAESSSSENEESSSETEGDSSEEGQEENSAEE